ncbi:MAG: hypothetical protein NTY96_08410 [Bacteroidetes bacterium]|nr:hypothetical protein [Bacteroidota bacterium]
MKTNLLLLLFLFTGIFWSNAQENSKKEVAPEVKAREIVDHLAKKIPMTKGQKDSVAIAFVQLFDDVQKYNAGENQKILDLLIKNRDEKIKKILHDDQKFDQFLLILSDIKKEMQENQGRERYQQHQQQQGGKHGGVPGMPGGG